MHPTLHRFLLLCFVFLEVSSTSIQSQGLPSSYDLRAVQTNGGVFSLVPSINNQGNTETCWTFGSATAIDSSLLKDAILPAATNPPGMVISSWDIAAHNGTAEPLNAPYNNLKGFGGSSLFSVGG